LGAWAVVAVDRGERPLRVELRHSYRAEIMISAHLRVRPSLVQQDR